MQVKKVVLSPNISFDFFHFQKEAPSNVNIFTRKYIPMLSTNSIVFISFEGNNPYNCFGITTAALGYNFSVYREVNKSDNLEFVTKLSDGTLSVIDHNIKNNHSYIYYIYKEDENYMSVASLTNEVKTCWWDWSLTGFYLEEESSQSSIYKVDESNIWRFSLNVESGTNSAIFNKVIYNTLSKYPKVSTGQNNYNSGTLTCILGNIQNNVYQENAELLKAWNYFCSGNELKLLKDRKGNAWIIDVIETSSAVDNVSAEQYNTITFNWTEIMSTDGISIVE